MNIEIFSIPHQEHRYDTVGDWFNLTKLTERPIKKYLTIRVSRMDNPDYEFLVGIHELIEAWLCQKQGIRSQDVDAFDRAHPDSEEPGNLPNAPYHKQHIFASHIEQLIATELGVDWDQYEQHLMEIS